MLRRAAELAFDAGVKWLGQDDSHAEVEFFARRKSPGTAAVRLDERCRFVREQRRWWYLDGGRF
jgi:SEC-C motif domain protein